MANFRELKKLYDESDFAALAKEDEGLYWLKLRSIGRAELIKQFASEYDIDLGGAKGSDLLPFLFKERPDEEDLEAFIEEVYAADRQERKANEEALISELYKMNAFDWGGLYQNSLEQTIVNNYVKKIKNWDALNEAINDSIFRSTQGYVRCSWYNHWTSIIIEDIFKDHPAVLPTIGLVKKVDFFINDIPFDLKVTNFPAGYLEEARQERGLRSEFSDLKAFAKAHDIHYDKTAANDVQFSELLAKIGDHPSKEAKAFIRDFKQTRRKIVDEAKDDPEDLIVWLYENQGVRRFDASNRFFLILIDGEDFEASWKLKRNKTLLSKTIGEHLDSLAKQPRDRSRVTFEWEGEKFTAYSDLLFVEKE